MRTLSERKRRNRGRMLARFAAGGMLFQMAGCQQETTQIAAGLVAGISSSVINQLISDRVSEFFNAPSI